MSAVLGYGEDALTLWALKHRISDILQEFDDKTQPSDCLVFYRPSFGRHSKESSAVFGEFDAIIASSRNIYLIESKWDNLGELKEEELVLKDEQILRHQIFAWYLTHWNKKYFGEWAKFVEEQKFSFNFNKKAIAPPKSLLATNLEFILNRLLNQCRTLTEENIKNVLLFFHKAMPKPSFKVHKTFKLVPIDYNKGMTGNFISLYPK